MIDDLHLMMTIERQECWSRPVVFAFLIVSTVVASYGLVYNYEGSWSFLPFSQHFHLSSIRRMELSQLSPGSYWRRITRMRSLLSHSDHGFHNLPSSVMELYINYNILKSNTSTDQRRVRQQRRTNGTDQWTFNSSRTKDGNEQLKFL
jgi:hypothetical protein